MTEFGNRENLLEVIRRMKLQKQAHPTDEDLAAQGKPHPEKKDPSNDEAIDQSPVGDAMNDGSVQSDKGEKGGVTTTREQETIDAGDGYGTATTDPPGNHPTDEELNEEGKSASYLDMAKAATEGLESVQSLLLKLSSGAEEETGEEQSEPDPDIESGEAMEDEEKDESDEKKKEEKKEEKKEAGELSDEEMEKAGYEAGQRVGDTLKGLYRKEKTAQIQDSLKAAAQIGYKEATMTAQALAEMLPVEVAEIAGEEGIPLSEDILPDAVLPEGGEQVMGSDEFVAVAKAIQSGKDPETPEEQEVAEILEQIGALDEAPDTEAPSVDDLFEGEDDGDDEDEEVEDVAMADELDKAARELVKVYLKAAKSAEKKGKKSKN